MAEGRYGRAGEHDPAGVDGRHDSLGDVHVAAGVWAVEECLSLTELPPAQPGSEAREG